MCDDYCPYCLVLHAFSFLFLPSSSMLNVGLLQIFHGLAKDSCEREGCNLKCS